MSITLTLTVAQVSVVDGRGMLTASVTNGAAVPARVVLGGFAPSGGAPSAVAWTSIDRPLRDLAAGATEQYAVVFAPPPGTAAGSYPVRFIAYSADQAPEEYADQARQVDVLVPAAPVVAPPVKRPWWPWAAAAALVVVVAVVGWLVLRGDPPVATPSTSPAPSSTSPSVPLTNTRWQLTAFEDGTVPVAGTQVTLRFTDGRVNGRACNSFSAPVVVAGSSITVGSIVSTLVFCTGAGVMDQERRVLDTLGAVTTVAQQAATLTLTAPDGRSLTFVAS
ncbi:META domain-containing protein [Tessaracoccus sp. SD287]|uniref:META domain-containing protein n=1 Tax=Tessaracoccus sp. SD287 TaxID=2782008 RepID=UPI001A965796|nr:META domain-containing protein [Tessaracoccus sp. SD287]MBO1031405.1 META domain-containing protein [Tessaracoccus sp. SD287]